MLEEIISTSQSLNLENCVLEKKLIVLIEEFDRLESQKANSSRANIDTKVNNSVVEIKINYSTENDYFTLKSVIESNSIYKEYKNYIFSYFDSCLVVRNEMINKSIPNMKYSYLFLLTHFFELVLKKVVIHQNISFKNNNQEPFKTHDIFRIISENESEFLNLGLKKQYYDILLQEFKTINSYCNQSKDFQESFKYPLKKDKTTSSITQLLIDLDINDLKNMVESHKVILFIGLLLYNLSNKENTIELIDMANNLIEKIKQ
ncbi:MAG: hypothetical protein WCG93_11075 [Paludibacter sp.]